MEELLSQLNEEQRAAAECIEGPLMIIAGAGSGKTRTLTFRIANLLQKGVDPFRILALTFTNKAAQEMKSRIIEIAGDQARNIWMGTFHSVFAKILRVEAEKLGYQSSFTIYDTDDSKNAIKQIVKSLGLDPKAYNPSYVLSRISMAKNGLISVEDYLANTEIQLADKHANKSMIGEIYKNYYVRLRNSMAMDFDDLLFNMNLLLRDFPEVLHKYQEKFRYILVDEYQDTNYSQYLIVKKLAARYENICVVGDDAQSIYAFRGANIRNILNFKKDYSQVKMFKLEQNYRSTQNIVKAANSVIANNKDQIHKEVWTDNEHGDKIQLFPAASEQEEASLVIHSIQETKYKEDVHNKDFAILYRTNMQSRALEESLRRMNIPYKIYGGLSFYKRKEIKDVLSYLRLLVNNHDDEALLRVVNYPARGIGQTTLDKLRVLSADHDCSLFTVMEHLSSFPSQLNTGTLNKIDEFISMIKAFSSQLPVLNAFEIASQLLSKIGLIRYLQDDAEPESASRIENIEELLNAINDFCLREEEPREVEDEELFANPKGLDAFLQQVQLLSGDNEKENENEDHVSLMTIHSAKGLEFPYVYVVGLEENIFPSALSSADRRELEEERRLFYVAITRAKKKINLSFARTRYNYGTPSFQEPSRFIEEIDPSFIDIPISNKSVGAKKKILSAKQSEWQETSSNTTTLQPKKKEGNLRKLDAKLDKQSSILPAAVEQIQVGMRVLHDKFGEGKVLQVEGADANKKALVFFEGLGQKTLILRFAKLAILT